MSAFFDCSSVGVQNLFCTHEGTIIMSLCQITPLAALCERNVLINEKTSVCNKCPRYKLHTLPDKFCSTKRIKREAMISTIKGHYPKDIVKYYYLNGSYSESISHTILVFKERGIAYIIVDNEPPPSEKNYDEHLLGAIHRTLYSPEP